MDLDRLISKEHKESEAAKSLALVDSQSFNHDTYTIDKIKEWKRAGIAKPTYISDIDWFACESGLTPKHKTLCKLKSAGMEDKAIAEFTGYSIHTIQHVLSSKIAIAETEKSLDDLWGKKIKQAIDDVIPMAVQTVFQIMMDPASKASVRADVAFKLMERTMGKPVQHIEMKDNLLRSVFEKLDAQSGKVIEMFKEETKIIEDAQVVESSEKSQETAKADPIDAWAKENI